MLESLLKHIKSVAVKSSRAYREGRYGLDEEAQRALEVLGLPCDSDFASVKRRYRELSKALHPDSSQDADYERFLRVKAAYDVLKSAYNKKDEHE